MKVRPSQIGDIDAIMGVKKKPMVASQQYPVDEIAYRETLRRVVGGENKMGIITTHFSTVEKEGKVIGYFRHDHYLDNGVGIVGLNRWIGHFLMENGFAAVPALRHWLLPKRSINS